MENPEQISQARRQKMIGVVSSASGEKTIRVVIQELVKHPRYNKYLLRRSKIAAHDAGNAAAKGDTVEITTCRRMSKTKAYRLLRVVKKATSTAPAAPADRG